MDYLFTLALVILFITAALLVITNSWRVSFVALAAQYLGVAILLVHVTVWQVVLARLLVGGGVVLILFLTGRETDFGRMPRAVLAEGIDPPGRLQRFEFATGFPFRVLAVVMAMLAAGYLAGLPNPLLPQLPFDVKLAGYCLCALGLLNVGLTEEPMNAGMGLLTLLIGFETMYAAVESSLAIVALLAAVDFGVALAVSYLALLRYASAQEISA